MEELDERILDNVLVITDLIFTEKKPVFGDLLALTGMENSEFPLENNNFLKLTDLGIEQADDYFSILNDDDNILWLIPLIKMTEVYHNPGPYDGLRFTYDILGNNKDNVEIYINCLERFIELFPVSIHYKGRKQENLEKIKLDIKNTVEELLKNGIEPGSDEALGLEY